MKIAPLAAVLCQSACGLSATGEEPAAEPPINWLGIFARDKETILGLY